MRYEAGRRAGHAFPLRGINPVRAVFGFIGQSNHRSNSMFQSERKAYAHRLGSREANAGRQAFWPARILEGSWRGCLNELYGSLHPMLLFR